MTTQISPMLAVSDGNAAIAFYRAAFGATLLWHLDGGHVVAGLAIEGAQFFLAHESPPHGTRSPDSVSFTNHSRLAVNPSRSNQLASLLSTRAGTKWALGS
jgi:PhnB protein